MKRPYWLVFILISVLFACGEKKPTAAKVEEPKQKPAKQQKETMDTKTKKGEPPPQLTLKDANELFSKGRCSEATNTYLEYLQKVPNDAGAYNLLGLTYLCERKFDQAMGAFQKALQLLPTYTDVHNNLGVAYMELKNYPDAKREFLIALDDPNYAKAGPYFNLAKLAFSQQSYEESRALAKKANELVQKRKDGLPKESGPLLLYSLSLERLNRLDEAETALRDLLKVDSSNIEASYSMATIMVRKNHPCAAKQYYLQVVDADPLGDLGQKSIEALKGIQCNQ
jgi:tetratricopeptide (TPR) repeat protein